MKSILAILVALTVCLAVGPSLAEIGEPPIVNIYHFVGFPNMEKVSELSLLVNEPCSLYADVIGDFPMTFEWRSDGDSIGSSILLADYIYSTPGEYVVEFEAIDVHGEFGSDTCIVTVTCEPSAVQPTTWGRVRSLFR